MHVDPRWDPTRAALPVFGELVAARAALERPRPEDDEFLELLQRCELPAAVVRWAEELAPGSWQARAAVCRQGDDEEEGGLLALARVSLAVLDEPEGTFYELKVPLPQTRGWGAAQRNELVREQALVACVRRLGARCVHLLEQARPLQGRLPIQFAFTKDWDECVTPLQKMLVREVLAQHLTGLDTSRRS